MLASYFASFLPASFPSPFHLWLCTFFLTISFFIYICSLLLAPYFVPPCYLVSLFPFVCPSSSQSLAYSIVLLMYVVPTCSLLFGLNIYSVFVYSLLVVHIFSYFSPCVRAICLWPLAVYTPHPSPRLNHVVLIHVLDIYTEVYSFLSIFMAWQG